MKNWNLKKLGEVCKFVGGSQPPKSNFSYEEKEGYIRLIQIRDYKSDKNIVYIPKDKAKRFCDSNDIMIGRYGPPVFQILKGLDGAYNVALMKAVPNEKVLSNDYAFLFLKHSKIQDYIIHLSQRAAGQTGVNKEAIEDYPILVPPLPEQQSIVAILEEVFAAIAKAKANAEQNLKNAKELFESYLQGVFETKGDDWEEKQFGEVITTLTDYHANGSYEVLKANVELKETEDFAWMVRSTDFENNFEKGFRYTDEKGYNFLSKSKIFGGEIIMSKIGNAGKVYLMPKVDMPCSLAMNLFLIRLDEKKAIPEFTFQFLKSRKGDLQIKSRLLGMATKTITKDNVRNIIIPFPPLKEQQAIVKQLDALSFETKKLEAVYQQKINDLEELKKSVLQKAFAGELKTATVCV